MCLLFWTTIRFTCQKVLTFYWDSLYNVQFWYILLTKWVLAQRHQFSATVSVIPWPVEFHRHAALTRPLAWLTLTPVSKPYRPLINPTVFSSNLKRIFKIDFSTGLEMIDMSLLLIGQILYRFPVRNLTITLLRHGTPGDRMQTKHI